MTDEAPTSQMQRIKRALAIETRELPPDELEATWKLASTLSERLACELWASKLGWLIPPYGTPEWQEMYSRWIGKDDE